MSELSKLKLFITPPHQCSYLEGQQASTLFIDPDAEINPLLYNELSEIGFRRSGAHFYRPNCAECNACIPSRVPVESFKPNRQQRKIYNRNQDLQVTAITDITAPQYYQLYERYICQRHSDGDMYPPSKEQFDSFLGNSLPNTQFYAFSLAQQLLAVAVTDRLSSGLSAIYTFFDPDCDRRSLGRYAVLWQIEQAKTLHLPYLYLGYWIKGCRKMSYKTDYRPLQLLINNRWQTLN
ncbi:MAG: arginyltransferase [Spongiibacteraceae bacterium]